MLTTELVCIVVERNGNFKKSEFRIHCLLNVIVIFFVKEPLMQLTLYNNLEDVSIKY